MKKGLLGSLLILLAGAGLAPGQVPPPPEPMPAPQPSAAGTVGGAVPTAASPAATAGDRATAPPEPPSPDEVPWNPPVRHADVWPYPQAVQVGEPDYAPPGDFWFVPEYLLWTIKGFHVPTLATTGTPASGGVLGRPGTAALRGGSEFGDDAFSGGRFTWGTWLDDEHCLGFQAGYFFLGQRLDRSDLTSPGGPTSPVLARPFTDARTGQQAALLVASPAQGPADVHTSFRSALQGAPADLVYELTCAPQYRIQLQAGFHYENLLEQVYVADAGTFPPDFPRRAGRVLVVSDDFHTQNILFGGDLGVRAEYHWGCWVGTLLGDLVLGSNEEVVHVVGGTFEGTRRRPHHASAVGGLLALPSNMGNYRQYEFSAIPELGLQVGYQFNPQVRGFVGYNFLYWSDVVRPGDQIDTAVNPAAVPALRRSRHITGPDLPAFSFRETDFWAQGLTVGAEIRY